jgi:hypothetical protein
VVVLVALVVYAVIDDGLVVGVVRIAFIVGFTFVVSMIIRWWQRR